MVEEGFITEAQAARGRGQRPLVVVGQPSPDRSIAPYFVEEIRKGLEEKYGADALYQAGLRVQTTLDAELQEAANLALDRGLRRIDKRRGGYPQAGAQRGRRGQRDRGVHARALGRSRFSPATSSPPSSRSCRREAARASAIGAHELELPTDRVRVDRQTSPADLFKVGDLIEVEVRSAAGQPCPASLALEQAPAVEGALLAIDNRTGQIRAMVGGFSFARSKFNRATQARRQVGSLFKPIVYTAAIDRGFTPVSVFIDEPVSYDRRAESAALSAAELRPQVRRAGHAAPRARAVAEYSGRESDAGDRTAPGRALRQAVRLRASAAVSLAGARLGRSRRWSQMTSAYSAFANRGVRMAPYRSCPITDRDGNLLEENRPEPHEAIRADTAFVMTNLLRGVVQRGTAQAAAALDWPLAGKTGTMDEYTDAWFIGFDPNITVGVWVGYDEKKPLGTGETGASAALPIWIDVHAHLHRQAGGPKGPARVRGARQHRVRDAGFGSDRGVHQRHAARRTSASAGSPRSRRTAVDTAPAARDHGRDGPPARDQLAQICGCGT